MKSTKEAILKLIFSFVIFFFLIINDIKVYAFSLKSLETALSFNYGNFNETKAGDILKILKINQKNYNSTSDEYMIQEEDVLKNNRKLIILLYLLTY